MKYDILNRMFKGIGFKNLLLINEDKVFCDHSSYSIMYKMCLSIPSWSKTITFYCLKFFCLVLWISFKDPLMKELQKYLCNSLLIIYLFIVKCLCNYCHLWLYYFSVPWLNQTISDESDSPPGTSSQPQMDVHRNIRRLSKDDSLSSSNSDSQQSGDEYNVYYFDPKTLNSNGNSSEKCENISESNQKQVQYYILYIIKCTWNFRYFYEKRKKLNKRLRVNKFLRIW